MSWRPARDSDLELCMSISPRHLGDELVGHDRALAAWRWLLRCPTVNSAVFEATAPAAGEAPLGFGAAIFAKTEFVDAELANPRPGLNARIIASIDAGNPVVLDEMALRHGNAHEGVDVACMAGAYRPDLSPDTAIETLQAMASSFVEAFSGYRNRRLIGEPIGESQIASYAASGIWCCVKSFDDLPDQENARWGHDRALFVMTRKEAYAVPIADTIKLFRDSAPILRLREPDQRLLQAALSGLTDEELAARLRVHVGTIKKRWLEIYRRMSEALPDLRLRVHDAEDGRTRGPQKRHRVLAYIREHPEELRPYEFSDAAQPSGG